MSEKMKHTPEPWRVADEGNAFTYGIDGPSGVAVVWIADKGGTDGISNAPPTRNGSLVGKKSRRENRL